MIAVIRGLMFKKHGRCVITKIDTIFLHVLLYLALWLDNFLRLTVLCTLPKS